MAERRMFAKTIVTSDAFLDMPPSARCLYFLLAMMADDDGFVNAPNSIMRQAGATLDDMKLLIAKRFVLTFESGVIVIKHWKIHNLIQKDRYKETTYLEEKALLTLDDKNAYTEAVTPSYPECIQGVSKVDTQVRLGQVSTGKDSVGEDIEAASPPPSRTKRFVPPAVEEVREYCMERQNGIDAHRFVDYYSSNGWMVGKTKMKDWKAAVRNWEQREQPRSKPKAKGSSNPFLDMLEDGSYE